MYWEKFFVFFDNFLEKEFFFFFNIINIYILGDR